MNKRQRKYNTSKISFPIGFTHARAHDSLKHGILYGEVRGKDKTLPLIYKNFTGETEKESCCFRVIPFFIVTCSGLSRFSKLRIVGGNRGD